MTRKALKPVCNKCDVPLVEDRRNSDVTHASCPVCGSDFGPMEEIEAHLSSKREEAFRDLWSWHAEPTSTSGAAS